MADCHRSPRRYRGSSSLPGAGPMGFGILPATTGAANTSELTMKCCFTGEPRGAWLAGTLAFFVLVVPLAGARQQEPSSPGTTGAPPSAVQETASNTGMVAGVVRGPGEVPVPGATVTVTGTTTGERKQTWTDEAGNYTLAALKPGVYKLEVSLVGFRDEVRDSVSVTAGEAVRVSLALRMGTPAEAAPEARGERTAGFRPPNSEALPERVPNRVPNSAMESGTAEVVGEAAGASGAGNVRFSEGAQTAGAPQDENSSGESESASEDSSASADNSFLLSGGVGQAPTPGGHEGGRREPRELRNALSGTSGFGGAGGFECRCDLPVQAFALHAVVRRRQEPAIAVLPVPPRALDVDVHASRS